MRSQILLTLHCLPFTNFTWLHFTWLTLAYLAMHSLTCWTPLSHVQNITQSTIAALTPPPPSPLISTLQDGRTCHWQGKESWRRRLQGSCWKHTDSPLMWCTQGAYNLQAMHSTVHCWLYAIWLFEWSLFWWYLRLCQTCTTHSVQSPSSPLQYLTSLPHIRTSSWLSRAIETAWLVLDELDSLWLPIIKTWRLNER